jgi:hypothetical protein
MWVIYIITVAGTLGLIKVGIAKDPEQRLKDLQTASPFKLALFGFARVGSYTAARTLEFAVHVALAPFWQVGEWFRVAPEDAQRTIIQKAADLGITITWVAAQGRRMKDLASIYRVAWRV